MGDLQRLADVLFDQEDRHPAPVQPGDQVEHLVGHQGGEAQGGLVEHEQLRPSHEAAGDREHLELPAAQRIGALGQAFVQYRKQLEDGVEVRVALFPGAVHVRPQQEVVPDGQLREYQPALGDLDDAAPADLMGGSARDVLPPEQDAPGLRGDDAADGHHGRGLARAVGADDGDDLSFLDVKVERVHRDHPAIGDAQVPDLKHGRPPGRDRLRSRRRRSGPRRACPRRSCGRSSAPRSGGTGT